jgi:hydroxypyruvate reductase
MHIKLKRSPGIYIAGFMGSGKSTVGRILAERLGWDFVDLDAEIENAEACTIASIFEDRGEPEFRRIETDMMRRWVRRIEGGIPTVVALGGGAFVHTGNFDLIENHGISIWLDCSFEEIMRRLGDIPMDRPLARDPEMFRTLYEERRGRALRSGFGGRCHSRFASLEMTERQLRKHALAIFKAALVAANPTAAVAQALTRRRDLDRYRRILVVGAGKASGTMAAAAEKVLGKRISAGCVNVKDGERARTRRIELHASGHPVPDERGMAGAQRIIDLCHEADSGDLVVCLISGGASALTPLPVPPITLAEKQETTKLLLACGATIHELNAVRKHISLFKGGLLAKAAAPARVLSLILSDVVGDDLDVIGSGPTAPDASTYQTALAVIDKYGLRGRLPANVRDRIESCAEETPKPGDPLFRNVENVVVGSNQKSLEAAAATARKLGYRTSILASTIEGETRDVARMHAAIARQIRVKGQPLRPPACIVSGGETTVTIHGAGKGGRNQEFALAAAIDIAGLENTLIFSAGTDGTDGPTDAAGAMADGNTVARSRRDAITALQDNDSYPFFADLNDLAITGSTGTNVMDLHLILVG